jgi:hypothetical protein
LLLHSKLLLLLINQRLLLLLDRKLLWCHLWSMLLRRANWMRGSLIEKLLSSRTWMESSILMRLCLNIIVPHLKALLYRRMDVEALKEGWTWCIRENLM